MFFTGKYFISGAVDTYPEIMIFEWFVSDVAGIVCSTMTYILVFYSQFVIVTVVLLPDPIISTVIQVLTKKYF